MTGFEACSLLAATHCSARVCSISPPAKGGTVCSSARHSNPAPPRIGGMLNVHLAPPAWTFPLAALCLRRKVETMPSQYTVGLVAKGKADRVAVDAEDALIAALKVKAERPDARGKTMCGPQSPAPLINFK